MTSWLLVVVLLLVPYDRAARRGGAPARRRGGPRLGRTRVRFMVQPCVNKTEIKREAAAAAPDHVTQISDYASAAWSGQR